MNIGKTNVVCSNRNILSIYSKQGMCWFKQLLFFLLPGPTGLLCAMHRWPPLMLIQPDHIYSALFECALNLRVEGFSEGNWTCSCNLDQVQLSELNPSTRQQFWHDLFQLEDGIELVELMMSIWKFTNSRCSLVHEAVVPKYSDMLFFCTADILSE